jgi:replicative DNA helicase
MGRISENVTEFISNAGQTTSSSMESEEIVLSAVLQNNAVINRLAQVLKTEDFYHNAHKEWYAGMLALADANSSISPTLLANKLGRPDDSKTLEALKAKCSDPNTVEDYLKVVMEKSLHRKMAKIGQKMWSASSEQKNSPDEIFESATVELFKLFSTMENKSFRTVHDAGTSLLERIETVASSDRGLTGLSTGFTDINTLTAGLHDENLIIVAGRPGQGKSALGMGVAKNVAVLEKAPVAFFSLEMSTEELVQRLLSSEARVASQKLRKPKELSKQEWQRLNYSLQYLSTADIFIDDTPMITPMQIRAKCRQLQFELMLQGKRLQLIVVDYLQLMSSSERRENRQQEVTLISRELKTLAKEMKCPVIALSQLNRQSEKRDDGRPKLTDLRESGAIEQDADVVMFIYREEQVQATPMNIGQAEIIVAKQRMGPTDTVILGFQKQFTRFENTKPEKVELILT